MGDRRDGGPQEEKRLGEVVREAERLIDHQVRTQTELDEKSQRGVTLTVAALGGGLALGSLVAGQLRPEVDSWFVALFVAGGLLNLAALVRLLDAYTGLRASAEMHVAPSATWLTEAAMSATWTLREHYEAVLRSIAAYERHNRRLMHRTAALRRGGLLTLLAAMGCYASGFFYILGRTLG